MPTVQKSLFSISDVFNLVIIVIFTSAKNIITTFIRKNIIPMIQPVILTINFTINLISITIVINIIRIT